MKYMVASSMAFQMWQKCQKFFFAGSNRSKSSVLKYKGHVASLRAVFKCQTAVLRVKESFYTWQKDQNFIDSNKCQSSVQNYYFS